MSRYDRQLQLDEVGVMGQARIGRLVLLRPSECSIEEAGFARLYAERCGMQVRGEPSDCASSTGETAPYPAHIARHFRHAASAAVGVGAAVTLTQVVAALFDQH